MAKNIINSNQRPRTTATTPTTPAPTFEHKSISAAWLSNTDETETFTINLYKVGTLVTMVVPQVLMVVTDVNKWMSEWVIPSGWTPPRTVATCFPALTKYVTLFYGEREYDVDTLCLAEVGTDGTVVFHRQPPPAPGVWTTDDETAQVGWMSFSMSWTAGKP